MYLRYYFMFFEISVNDCILRKKNKDDLRSLSAASHELPDRNNHGGDQLNNFHFFYTTKFHENWKERAPAKAPIDAEPFLVKDLSHSEAK